MANIVPKKAFLLFFNMIEAPEGFSSEKSSPDQSVPDSVLELASSPPSITMCLVTDNGDIPKINDVFKAVQQKYTDSIDNADLNDCYGVLLDSIKHLSKNQKGLFDITPFSKMIPDEIKKTLPKYILDNLDKQSLAQAFPVDNKFVFIRVCETEVLLLQESL